MPDDHWGSWRARARPPMCGTQLARAPAVVGIAVIASWRPPRIPCNTSTCPAPLLPTPLHPLGPLPHSQLGRPDPSADPGPDRHTLGQQLRRPARRQRPSYSRKCTRDQADILVARVKVRRKLGCRYQRQLDGCCVAGDERHLRRDKRTVDLGFPSALHCTGGSGVPRLLAALAPPPNHGPCGVGPHGPKSGPARQGERGGMSHTSHDRRGTGRLHPCLPSPRARVWFCALPAPLPGTHACMDPAPLGHLSHPRWAGGRHRAL